MSAPPSAEILYVERIVWGPSYPLSAVLAVVGIIQLFTQWILGAILLGAAALVMWFCVAHGAVLITTRRGKRLQLSSRHPNELLVSAASLIE